MIHPATELRKVNDAMGYGVFATTLIPKGAIVYIKDDLELLFAPDDPRLNDPRYADTIETYAYLDPHGVHILSWDHARFVNHCCDANTMSSGYNFEIALRDIHPGEQITDEYGLFNIRWSLQCQCGSPDCRGVICREDLELYADQWDAKLRDALRRLLHVDQPLLTYMDVPTRRTLMRYLKTGYGYRSCRALQYHPPQAVVA